MNILSSGIILEPQHWEKMKAEVSSRNLEEACGLIAGKGNIAKLVVPITNILHDLHRFRMDPEEQLKAFLLAEENGWEILAIYHSHPYGIYQPSATDFSEVTFPGIVYLIWYQIGNTWNCRGYLMISTEKADEVPVIISTQ